MHTTNRPLRAALLSLCLLGSVAAGHSAGAHAQTGATLARGWRLAQGVSMPLCYGPQYQVLAGGPGLVAFNGCAPSIWTSPDGGAWTQVSLPPLQLDNVAGWSLFVQGHIFMLTGVQMTYGPGPSQTELLVSSDGGASWSKSGADLQISATVSGGEGILALARGSTDFQSSLWTSSDGLTWKPVADAAGTFGSASISALVKGGPGWIVGGSVTSGAAPPSDAIWSSPDGRTWTRADLVSAAPGSGITALIAGGKKALAVASGQDGTTVFASQDGVHWQEAKNAPPGILSYGNPTIAAFEGGFTGFLDEGGETAIWSSPDGLTWTRVGGDEAFGGTARISGVIPNGNGLVAVGSFALHPGSSCLSAQGADQTDLRAFQSAVFLWSPNGSAQADTAIASSDPGRSKLLPSDLGQRLDSSNIYSYRSSYLNLCAETSRLGKHTAYQLVFPLASGQPGSSPGVTGQELTILAADTSHAQSAFQHAAGWMFAGVRPKQVHSPVRLGDQTQAYSFKLPSDGAPAGITYTGYAVMWRRNAAIGEIFTTDLSLSGALAKTQFQRYESPQSPMRFER